MTQQGLLDCVADQDGDDLGRDVSHGLEILCGRGTPEISQPLNRWNGIFGYTSRTAKYQLDPRFSSNSLKKPSVSRTSIQTSSSERRELTVSVISFKEAYTEETTTAMYSKP
jgi:hypothetical protein